ncbi:hypothetical protein H6F86_16775 [Phormidium sp. FACHB-592]|uniref:Uncharacterized protein n=1 Tax=Stenomitos frigidus AS-A4 TaxID=2933935 RepID=A0ABV0KU53_9CYAN|nr:hypothetical protein [Phormidium sp. FACHB-592]MBD2075520.1 hypothetical protein [Phormidium sp. FACHB-592]
MELIIFISILFLVFALCGGTGAQSASLQRKRRGASDRLASPIFMFGGASHSNYSDSSSSSEFSSGNSGASSYGGDCSGGSSYSGSDGGGGFSGSDGGGSSGGGC